ncbi:hypothetical protein O3P69_012918 [Scylla paramamosain]|uniref:Uncharacterized protein n=1 Tax=Scylla paramamosain TaxID=85552 RepID=A0AAW0TTR6_SCYPA
MPRDNARHKCHGNPFIESWPGMADGHPHSSRVVSAVLDHGMGRFDLSTVPLPPLYDAPLNLSEEKLSDLTRLLCLMPDDKKAFYQGLQAGTVEHNVVPPDEDDDEVLDYDN